MCLEWDWPEPFQSKFQASAEQIDELNHVNNAVYVQWMEDCAWQHSQSLGLDVKRYQELDRGMAIVRHEIDYLASAYLGEELCMGTWIVAPDNRLKMDRLFQLIRPADGATLLRARTTFVCVQLTTGRPKRMPEEFLTGYGKAWRDLDKD